MPADSITIFGEALFDCFPDGSRILGGAPFNVAWHLQGLGAEPLFVSRIGRDAAGAELLAAMQNHGMRQNGVEIDAARPTGSVAVSIDNGQPSYRILEQQAYDYIAAMELPAGSELGLLYHGSLALRHGVSLATFEQIKRQWRGPVFFDVNLRAPWWDADAVHQWMSAADWLKLNDEELALLLPEEHAIDSKLRLLQQRYDLQGVVVTRGEHGALALTQTGEFAEVQPAASVEVVDTVGAGDAFAAVVLLGIDRGWPLRLTLARAQDFASAIVGRRGATVRDPEFYRQFSAAWSLIG
ncbi:PfkB family carbohydrate kinase [Methylomonas sp. DH-1]|uniref:PfkB family carbohydrate kinase n=1 Tax=Methylomonas sp. (strain DH-1) TaxID=1727196 RepID=UPI0007C8C107|nr:PfkB family carbohydrate kinase [Methylomonas sp. DH-1]ANE56331.1 carbohydrate kinase [Methylomonas sp. DH-1]